MLIRATKTIEYKDAERKALVTLPAGWSGEVSDKIGEAAVRAGMAVAFDPLPDGPADDDAGGPSTPGEPSFKDLQAQAKDRGVATGPLKTKADLVAAIERHDRSEALAAMTRAELEAEAVKAGTPAIAEESDDALRLRLAS